MRILFAAQKYDYGRRGPGFGFEYYNFYEALVAMGHEVEYFDINAEPAGDQLSSSLVRRASTSHPDLLFACLFRDELTKESIRQISDAGDTVTFNWFTDDHWRFESFSREWAPYFNFVSTTAHSALPKYRAAGISHVLPTQWGAAARRYRPAGLALVHEVTFVGQNYGDRAKTVRELRAHGLEVGTWGAGWAIPDWQRELLSSRGIRKLGGRQLFDRRAGATRCSQEDMIAIFEQSKVSLNLSSASHGLENQIKGRTFEIPACRGLLVTGAAAHLDEYYEPNREMLVYQDTSELAGLCGRALADEVWRTSIVEAGYRRTLAEHTYEHRFNSLFARMGFKQ